MATKKLPISEVASKSISAKSGTFANGSALPGKAAKAEPVTLKASKTGPLTTLSAEIFPATGKLSNHRKPKKPLPADTLQALAELEAGTLNTYANADEMFEKLGIKVAKTKA